MSGLYDSFPYQAQEWTISNVFGSIKRMAAVHRHTVHKVRILELTMRASAISIVNLDEHVRLLASAGSQQTMVEPPGINRFAADNGRASWYQQVRSRRWSSLLVSTGSQQTVVEPPGINRFAADGGQASWYQQVRSRRWSSLLVSTGSQ